VEEPGEAQGSDLPERCWLSEVVEGLIGGRWRILDAAGRILDARFWMLDGG
jgi:hypothetical protein